LLVHSIFERRADAPDCFLSSVVHHNGYNKVKTCKSQVNSLLVNWNKGYLKRRDSHNDFASVEIR
jgi:hypothetical protein